MVSCGPLHTACVTATGALYTWGEGSDGELGHSPVDGELGGHALPRRVESLDDDRVIHVACGLEATCIITFCGKLLVWCVVDCTDTTTVSDNLPLVDNSL